MEAPLLQEGINSTQQPRTAQQEQTCCEVHVCLVCPDETPLACGERACCYADLTNSTPAPRSGCFACVLNAILPGCGTCTVGCLKGSRRAKVVGFLTMVVTAVTVGFGILLMDRQCRGRVEDEHEGEGQVSYHYETGLSHCSSWALVLIALAATIVLVTYTCNCAWSMSLAQFLCAVPGDPPEPVLKFMTAVPIVNPCEAAVFGVLNCFLPGVGALCAAAAGTENRMYGVEAGSAQIFLAGAPTLVVAVLQIVLIASFGLDDKTNPNNVTRAAAISTALFWIAIVFCALGWLWSCLYGYLLIKQNTQLCSGCAESTDPPPTVVAAAAISRPASPGVQGVNVAGSE